MPQSWIALLRGANPEKVTVEDLDTALSEIHCTNPLLCPDADNIAFESDLERAEIEESLKKLLRTRFFYRGKLVLVAASTLKSIVDEYPFESSDDQGHVLFLQRYPVRPNFQQMERFKAAGEEWCLTDDALYFRAPGEFRKSKLAVRLERLLGVGTAARSWEQAKVLRDSV